MSSYLGKVNRVSLLPSVLALVSLGVVAVGVVRQRGDPATVPDRWAIHVFLLLALGAIMVGYLWFLIMYPSPGKGATIKATYVLHIFPLVAVVVGVVLEKIEKRSPRLYYVLLGILCVVCIHNIPAMVTHY